MSLNTDAGTQLPVRRRPSLLMRARPRTAAMDKSAAFPATRPQTAVFHEENGGYRTNSSAYQDTRVFDENATLDPSGESDSFCVPAARHRPSKSFSSLRHGVSELRAVARRLSVTIRHKSPKQSLAVPHEGESENHFLGRSARVESSRSGSWRHQRNHQQSRRPSLGNINTMIVGHHAHPVLSPIPGSGTEPPVIPDDMMGGAAARAAAAAQNEMAKLSRVDSKNDSKIFDFKQLPKDSESGIGIDMRDRVDDSDNGPDVVRRDPLGHLPSELMAHILAYLDPDSLMDAQLVSHAWNKESNSRHVWRDVFRREYRRLPQATHTSATKPRACGLGKTRPNQDWKRMVLVRRSLERRWREGKAAAIYLHGHKDSVYCVQFDENKIITGSRDQTIRIWDAHYPWPCLKVIGASPTDNDTATPNLAANQSSQPNGSSPFISICPPARSTTEVATSLTETSDYHKASILCLQFDDNIMVTGSSDFTCIVWDVKNDYRPIRRLRGHTAGVLDVCFDDRYIVSCSKDTSICVWDRHTGDLIKKLTGHRGPVNAVQLRGDLIVSASGDGVAKLWNITSGLCIKEFPSKDRGLACVEFSEDARTILAGGNDKVIYQFDANTGDLVNELKGHSGLVRSLHLDSVNNRIVSGSYDMSVKVFDSQSGELSIDLPGWTTSWMLSAKSDYRRIVATSQDSRAVIMDFGYGLSGIDLLEE